jgi:hypothetical protein
VSVALSVGICLQETSEAADRDQPMTATAGLQRHNEPLRDTRVGPLKRGHCPWNFELAPVDRALHSGDLCPTGDDGAAMGQGA